MPYVYTFRMYKRTMELAQYFQRIRPIIATILSRSYSETIAYDILDTTTDIQDKQIALRVKQRQMRIGCIWQIAIGNYGTMTDLGIGHETGLDILSVERKIAIELKNRTNTDNSSSRLSNWNKLAKFKRLHPDYECIYGCVNDDKSEAGEITTITHDGVEIKKYTGNKLLTHIFGSDTANIVSFLRDIIHQSAI